MLSALQAQPVEIAAGRLVLRGELRSAGADWAVLVHDFGEDLDAWLPLAVILVNAVITVLVVDLRGHGASDGEPDAAAIGEDIDAILDFAAAGGASRIFVGAAGRSAACALDVAQARPGRIGGLFLISPIVELGQRLPRLPMLFVIGQEQADDDAVASAAAWSRVARLPAQGGGLRLLQGAMKKQAAEQIVRFLTEIRSHPPAPFRPHRVSVEEKSK